MNNLKLIRELYGATQEQVAEAISVNRVTVANWENGNSQISSSNKEKLSLYFGIGPEYFYDKKIDEESKELIIDTSKRAKKVSEQSGGERNKESDLHNLFEEISFNDALKRYMFSMKILLAKADDGSLDKLKLALAINDKIGTRLKAIISLREQEASNDELSLFEMMEQIEQEN